MERMRAGSSVHLALPAGASSSPRRPRRVVTAVGVVAALLIAGLGSSTTCEAATTAAGRAAKPRGEVAGTVDIGGGRKMYLECRGSGSPTVVLTSGHRDNAETWISSSGAPRRRSDRSSVLPKVAKFTRVCAYDRPGTTGRTWRAPFSRSDPVPQPTTGQDGANDLHALLSAAREPGPYVLVGHSAGGLIDRLFASAYPQDVAGLVLVDASSEGLYDRLTPEQRALFDKLTAVVPAPLASYQDLETMDIVRTFEQVKANPVRPVPTVVLTADHSPSEAVIREAIAAGVLPPDTPPDFGAALWKAQLAAQDELAQIVPNAKHVTKTNSGHYLQLEQPKIVINAIREVVDTVRSKRPKTTR
jgi:pimeloyl-ACP methyl ester carboxylesterase